MAQLQFKCNHCLKEFAVKFVLFKPGQIKCPYCGSLDVRENKSTGCGCGSNKGFFT